MFCCFCNKELKDIGNSPYPFLKKKNPTGGEYGCCDNCNKLFVSPARQLIKYGISDDDWDQVLYRIKTSFEEIIKESNLDRVQILSLDSLPQKSCSFKPTINE